MTKLTFAEIMSLTPSATPEELQALAAKRKAGKPATRTNVKATSYGATCRRCGTVCYGDCQAH